MLILGVNNILFFCITLFKLCSYADASNSYGVKGRYSKDQHNAKNDSRTATYRMQKLLETFYIHSGKQIESVNDIRFMYEESPHYEQGYMMHEIIERYKKMVEHMNMMMFPTRTVPSCMDFVAHMQHIYIEMYHLVNMFHEIPRKWQYLDEFNEEYLALDPEVEKVRLKEVREYEKQQRKKERKRKKRLRDLHKARQKFGNMSMVPHVPGSKKQPYNNLWRTDYGWEIDKEDFKELNH